MKVGVLGCGRIAAVYLPVLKQLEQEGVLTLTAAYDPIQERAEAFAANFRACQASPSLEAFWQQGPESVHVLTPHHIHEEQVIACLSRGIHVLTEKPLTINRPSTERILAAWEASSAQLGVIFQNRYIDGIAELRSRYLAGEFGALKSALSTLHWFRPESYYACDWKGRWATEGGGVVIDQAIHSLDLVRYVANLPVVSVKAMIDRRILKTIEVEDVADAAITFANGAVYSFFACNYHTRNKPIQIEWNFEHAVATLNGTELTLVTEMGEERFKPDPAKILNGEAYWGNYHEQQIREYYSRLQLNEPVAWDPRDAAKSGELVFTIYESAKTKQAIDCDI